MLGHDLHQALEELAPGQRVEARHRLVEDEELGPLGDRDRQRQLGALASRERPGALLGVEVEVLEPPLCHGGVPLRVHVRAEGEMVVHCQAGVGRRVLGDEAHACQLGRVVARRVPEDFDPPCRRGEEADGEVQQGRLAGAVRADQADDVAGGDVEVALVQRPATAVALAQTLGTEDPRSRYVLLAGGPKGIAEQRFDAVVVEPGAPRLDDPALQRLAQRSVRGERLAAE